MLETQRQSKFDVRSYWREFVSFMRPTLVIMQREIQDTMRDWRIVLPIFLLVGAFPFLANFAAGKALDFVNQYGAGLISERLFPFLMLVVGFFPSSFSLVIALEVFVGEKERRSLESLLATQLTDTQLYVGKLLAATVPPVLASYLGMAFYLLLLGLSLGWWPEPSLLLVSFVLSTAEALVMVSGAVIVSSQSTSVRASNLLASFIIIPMAFLLQAEASMLLFAQYGALWLIALFLLVLNVLLIRLGLRIFDRENLLGRDIDKIDVAGAWRTFWGALWPKNGLKALYLEEVPALLRGMRPELLVTCLVVFVGGFLVGLWGRQVFPLPPEILDFNQSFEIDSMRRMVSVSGLLEDFTIDIVFYHNVRSLLAAALLALFSMGIIGILLLTAPISILAYIGLLVAGTDINPLVFFGAFVLPHAIFELPAAIIATAQAMRMGDIILQPPSLGGGVSGIIREMGHFVKIFIAVTMPLLLIAAAVEVLISPRVVVHFFGG